MTVHDVSREMRDPHGKWSRGGQVLHRLTKEAEVGAKQAAEGKLQEGHRVKYKTGATGVVHHVDEKGVPHVVWDRGRGKPVRTPAHHLTRTEGEAKPAEKAATSEKAARDLAAKQWRQEKLKEIGYGEAGIGPHPNPAGPNARNQVSALLGGPAEHMGGQRYRVNGKLHDVTFSSSGHAVSARELTSSEMKSGARHDPTAHRAPGGGSKRFPNGMHVSVNGGRYRGEDGEVIAGGDQLRPGLLHVQRKDGSTFLVKEANVADAKMSYPEAQSRVKDYLSKKGSGGKYRQPTPEAQRGEINKRSQEAAAVKDKWMGKQATITSGPHAGITGKVVQADRYGVTIQASDGTRYTPGHNQFREARSGGAKSPDELRKMIAEAEVKAKAAQEAENKSRLPGGSQTVYDKPFHRAGGETQDYLKKLRGGSTGPDVSMNEKISRLESRFAEGGIDYSPQSLVDTRLHEVMDDLKNYPRDKTITVKVPSGSEVQIPRDVAEELVKRVQNANRKSYGFRY